MTMAEDNKLIGEIADRAVAMFKRFDLHPRPSREVIILKLRVVHEMIVPLRLQEMLNGRDLDFSHDIGGILAHLVIGPQTRLTGCFLPRFAEV